VKMSSSRGCPSLSMESLCTNISIAWILSDCNLKRPVGNKIRIETSFFSITCIQKKEVYEMHTKPKHMIQKVTISHPNGVIGSKDFASFEDANAFLIRLASFLDEDTILNVSMTWEGGLEYIDTLSLSSDVKGPNYLEKFLQNAILHNLLIPTEAKTLDEMYQCINVPSLQMERITIPESNVDVWQSILTDCQGFNDEEVLKTFDLFEQAMRKADREHPLLLSVIKEGRAVIQKIHEMKSTKLFHKKSIEAARELYANLLTELFQNHQEAFFQLEEQALQFQKSIEMEEEFPDERFTLFGIEMYQLFPADSFFLNANANQLLPLDNKVTAAYFSRLETLEDAFSIHPQQKDAYSVAYMTELHRIYLKPIAFRSHYHVSVNAVQSLLKRGADSEQVRADFLNYDPFVPFFPETVYEGCVFHDTEEAVPLQVSV